MFVICLIKIAEQMHLETFFSILTHVISSPTGTVAEGAPIIPISAQLKYNIEVVCEYVEKKIPIPIRDFTSQPKLIGKLVTGEPLLDNLHAADVDFVLIHLQQGDFILNYWRRLVIVKSYCIQIVLNPMFLNC